VVTQDGYILTVFRIPYGVKSTNTTHRPPVYLQHGLLDSSFTWILNEPYESLSYILADAGYDVWMGNQRGNIYGTQHVNLSIKSEAFWSFSWDQMAQYDFPALINHVSQTTGFEKISYIGHSEGTLVPFAALSASPQLAEKLNIFIGLGPLITVGHITNEFFRLLADFDVDEIFLLFGVKDFLPTNKLLESLLPHICEPLPLICEDVIELLCGPHKGSFNASRMQVMAGHEPGGTSVQNVAHFAQGIRNDNFAKFDYGSAAKNREHYGTSTPPSYDISQFPTSDILPVALFYGTADELADPTDVAFLIGNLPSPPIYERELANYAHLDYVWDIDAYTDFYPEVLTLIQNAVSKSSATTL
jgi:pimeloyl-ACP methyl ester carboxylesterase